MTDRAKCREEVSGEKIPQEWLEEQQKLSLKRVG